MSKRNPHRIAEEPEPTSNIISLAHEGFKFARLVNEEKGLYVGKMNKIGATHNIKCTRAEPRILTKDVPTGVIRMCYEHADNFKEFPNTEDGRTLADQQMAWWKELAANSAPTSAVAIPRGRAYKNFVARRTEAAADGSLYDTKPKKGNAIMATNKTAPKPPGKKSAVKKDTKNEITRPKEGTTTGKVWDICDKLGAERAAVIKEGTKRGINIATITTQYGKWRKYNGIEGRAAAPKKKKAPAAPKKKAPAAPAVTA